MKKNMLMKGFVAFSIFIGIIALGNFAASYFEYQKSVSKLGIIDPYTPFLFPRSSTFALTTLIDPIWGMSGNDASEVSAGIQATEESFLVLEKYHSASELARIREVYPKEYLHSLPAFIEAEKELLEAPSPVSVLRYHHNLMQSLEALEEALDTTLRAITKSGFGDVHFYSGSLSSVFLKGQLTIAKQRVRQARSDARGRVRCWIGLRKYCTDVRDKLDTIEQWLVNRSVTAPLDYLESTTVAFLSQLHAEATHRGLSYTTDPQYKRAIIRSTCVPNNDVGVFEVGYIGENTQNVREGVLRLTGLNELLLFDLSRTSPGVEIRRQTGEDIYTQTIGALYNCANGGIDYGTVAALLAIANQRGYGSENLSEGTVFRLLLSDFKEARRDGTLDRALLQHIRLLRERTSRFDEMLISIAGYILNAEPIFRTVSLDPVPLFFFRFAPSTLYQFGNETLYQQPLSLYEKRDHAELKKYYTYVLLSEDPSAISFAQATESMSGVRVLFSEGFFADVIRFSE